MFGQLKVKQAAKANVAPRLEIDPEVLGGLMHIAEERGVDVNVLINTKLRALVTSYERGRQLGLDDIMPMGQYSGSTIRAMIDTDPRYTSWLAAESDVFQLTPEAQKYLDERK